MITDVFDGGNTISIINFLQEDVGFDAIIAKVKDIYTKIEQTPKPQQTRKTLPDELLTNSNGAVEAMAQHKILMGFVEYTKNKKYGLFMLGARIKLFDCCGKRHPNNINLFDFVRFKLNEKTGTVKKDTTKAEYRVAIKIVDMLDQGLPMEQISNWLDEVDRQHK